MPTVTYRYATPTDTAHVEVRVDFSDVGPDTSGATRTMTTMTTAGLAGLVHAGLLPPAPIAPGRKRGCAHFGAGRVWCDNQARVGSDYCATHAYHDLPMMAHAAYSAAVVAKSHQCRGRRVDGRPCRAMVAGPARLCPADHS